MGPTCRCSDHQALATMREEGEDPSAISNGSDDHVQGRRGFADHLTQLRQSHWPCRCPVRAAAPGHMRISLTCRHVARSCRGAAPPPGSRCGDVTRRPVGSRGGATLLPGSHAATPSPRHEPRRGGRHLEKEEARQEEDKVVLPLLLERRTRRRRGESWEGGRLPGRRGGSPLSSCWMLYKLTSQATKQQIFDLGLAYTSEPNNNRLYCIAGARLELAWLKI